MLIINLRKIDLFCTTKRMIWSLILLSCLLPSGCSGDDAKWPSPSVEVDITPYYSNICDGRLAFSTDSQLICYGTLSANGQPLYSFFDAKGNKVQGPCDANGTFTIEGAKAFPTMMASPEMSIYTEGLRASSPFSNWLANAGGWGFNSDFSLGLRLVNPRCGYTLKKITIPTSRPVIWTAELWQLVPTEKRLWSVNLLAEIGRAEPVGFFVRDGKPLVLIGFGGDYVYILSQEDGRLIEIVDYKGRVKPVPENRPKDWKPYFADWSTAPFRNYIAFSPSRNLLAFMPAFEEESVTVISLNNQPCIVFSGDPVPEFPGQRGGAWKGGGVQFSTDGDFLIADYQYGGRSAVRTYYPTVILDTHTWKRVWWENSTEIKNVTLSPKGKKMAFIRVTRESQTLEYGPFNNKSTNAE